jgi:hypothetical protein
LGNPDTFNLIPARRLDMKTARILAMLALLGGATGTHAQELGVAPGRVGHEGGVRFIVGSPAGEFGDSVDNEGFGLAAHYGVRPVPALTFGVGGDVMIYGSESQTYSLPLVEDFELTTNNNLASGSFFAQWRPVDGIFQPYAEARAGIRYLWTESKLEDEDFFDDGEVGRETNYDDFATFWGGGGGMLIRVKQGGPGEAGRDRSPSVFIDLKVTRLHGANAEYLTEGDITVVNDAPVFNASESETDLTTFELGVVLTF